MHPPLPPSAAGVCPSRSSASLRHTPLTLLSWKQPSIGRLPQCLGIGLEEPPQAGPAPTSLSFPTLTTSLQAAPGRSAAMRGAVATGWNVLMMGRNTYCMFPTPKQTQGSSLSHWALPCGFGWKCGPSGAGRLLQRATQPPCFAPWPTASPSQIPTSLDSFRWA